MKTDSGEVYIDEETGYMKTVEPGYTWEHRVNEHIWFVCRMFAGSLMTLESDNEYFRKCIVEAHGFMFAGKAVKDWEKKTGRATYRNGKEAYVGVPHWGRILQASIATPLLADILKRSVLKDGERKNS